MRSSIYYGNIVVNGMYGGKELFVPKNLLKKIKSLEIAFLQDHLINCGPRGTPQRMGQHLNVSYL